MTMSIRSVWDNSEKTTLRFIVYGSWQWSDMDKAVQEAQAMFSEVSNTVHVIVDLRESTMLADHAKLESARPFSLSPSPTSHLAFVGIAAITVPFFQCAKRLYRLKQPENQVAFVETLPKARQAIFRDERLQETFI